MFQIQKNFAKNNLSELLNQSNNDEQEKTDREQNPKTLTNSLTNLNKPFSKIPSKVRNQSPNKIPIEKNEITEIKNSENELSKNPLIEKISIEKNNQNFVDIEDYDQKVDDTPQKVESLKINMYNNYSPQRYKETTSIPMTNIKRKSITSQIAKKQKSSSLVVKNAVVVVPESDVSFYIDF